MHAILFCCAAWVCATEPPPVRLAYFVPSDRQPIDGYVARLDRTMTEVQRFYRTGMEAAGYGPRTFALERDSARQLVIHLVRGQQPARHYGRDAAAAVRREVKAVLGLNGIEVDGQTLLIFQVLLDWEGPKAIEVGPYVGGGNHLAGTAWVYDDARLDAALLSSKSPGGYYGRPCSIGEFNSHYVGGIAHELGHAFGLPHDCQQAAERKQRGLSLMGGGNHTYGQELRQEGPGTFLSAGSAMLLAYSRPFAGELPGARSPASSRLRQLDARFESDRLVLLGTVDAQPAAFGVVAFDDWQKVKADYEAVSWTSKIGPSGQFRLEIGELRQGPSQLRLKFCHSNGAASTIAFDYLVDQSGRPSLEVFRDALPLAEAVAAYGRGDRAALQGLAGGRRGQSATDTGKKLAHLLYLASPPPPAPVHRLPLERGWASLSRATFTRQTTGWGAPRRDEVPIETPGRCFIEVGGRFFDRGLYAHAPSTYELALDGRWRRLRSGYGLQDGHRGSVVFVVRGDGRELFRSPPVDDRDVRTAEVDVGGVRRLELVVEDGGNGGNADWGVWLRPELSRTDRD